MAPHKDEEIRIHIRLVPKDEWIEGMRKAGDLGYGHDLTKPFTWGPRWNGPLQADRPTPEVRRRVLSRNNGDPAPTSAEGEGAEES